MLQLCYKIIKFLSNLEACKTLKSVLSLSNTTLCDVTSNLKSIYCGKIGYEFRL